MSNLLPLASFNLELQPFSPEPCQPEDFPVTVRLTLAAINPDAFDDKEEPSTLRILKKSTVFDDSDDEDDDEEFYEDEEDEEVDSEEEKAIAELERLEAEEKEAAKTAKEEAKANGEDANKDDDEDNEDSEDDEDDEDDEDGIEEHIVCTLSPKLQFQQTLDLTILPDEEVYFVVTGSYAIHLTGNYVEHPFDDDEDDYSGEDSEEEEDSDYDSEDYDLTPDEDEVISGEEFDLDELDEVEDVEGKIEELVEAESKSKKRSAEEAREDEAKETPKQSKKAKKEAAKKEKSVKFNKDLEQGPTVTATKKEEKVAAPAKKEVKKEEPKKKMPVKTLAGGVTIEDKTIGSGPVCKKGQKVGVRYIGKLKNGKSFDKNTSGKPFTFGLGKGEVIKGWDLGVAGMAVGGERRIVIPPAMAYGSRKLPGIPSNSELTFDVKLLSIK